jgi:hypothetical protein
MNINLKYFDPFTDPECLCFYVHENDMYLHLPYSNEDTQHTVDYYRVIYKVSGITKFITTRWQNVYSDSQKRYDFSKIEDGVSELSELGYGNYLMIF